MKESGLTSRLIVACTVTMPGCVIFKHFDVATDGIPDLSMTWNRRTCWVEVKYMEGETRETQIVTMKRLAQMGKAWYVRFDTDDAGPRTVIYDPLQPPYTVLDPNRIGRGHDTKWVAEFIRKELEAA